jgi:hypothetical protein
MAGATDVDYLGMVFDPERRGGIGFKGHPSASLCPFIDTKTNSFCSLTGKMCPWVGFVYNRCKIYIDNMGKASLGHQIGQALANTKQPGKVQEILTEAKQDLPKSFAEKLAKEHGDLNLRINSDPRAAADILLDAMREADLNVPSTARTKKAKVTQLKNMIVAYMTRVQKGSRTGVDAWARSVASALLPGLEQEDAPQVSFNNPNMGVSFDDEPPKKRTSRRRLKLKAGRNRAAEKLVLSKLRNKNKVVTDDAPKHEVKAAGSKGRISSARFMALWNTWQPETRAYMERSYPSLLKNVEAGKYTSDWLQKFAVRAGEVNKARLREKETSSSITKAQAKAWETGKRLGTIPKDFAQSWEQYSGQGQTAIAKGMNGILDKYTKVQYKTQDFGTDEYGNKIKLTFAELRGTLPVYDKSDIEVARQWDAFGMRLVSYYHQYGQGFGKWLTFLHLLKMAFMGWLLSLGIITPENLKAIDRFISPAPFYGLYFWFKKQIPTLQMSRDTKRDIFFNYKSTSESVGNR